MKNKNKEQYNEDGSPQQQVPNTPRGRHRKTINEQSHKSSGKGLDLSLFEGHVPADTICAFCRCVLVQPKVGSCQHVFCAHCLRGHIRHDCPICGERLQETSQQPPPQLCMKLLNLTLRCDTKCGQVMLLGELPQHMKQDCPNAPVPCLYARKGCRMKVKRCELEDHIKECDFRPVQCEACGGETTYRELVAHQKRSQCVENRIKNQLFQAVRFARLEEKNHKKALDKQRVHMDIHQRRTEVEHARRLTTARVQRQLQQNYQLQRSHSQYFMRSTSPSKMENRGDNDFQNQRNQPSRSDVTSRVYPNTSSNATRHSENTDPTNSYDTNGSSNVFVTHMVESEDGNVTSGASDISGDNSQWLACKNCNKPFRRKRNKANSCRWHAGPIVEVFGGTCFTCGRLDYQLGCMVGFHEA